MNRLFISVEGIDGAGKSSHIDAMAAAMRATGHGVCVTREPGGTPLAEKLREVVLHTPMDALTESLLIFAARRDHIAQVIRPALARGELAVLDIDVQGAELVRDKYPDMLGIFILPPSEESLLTRLRQRGREDESAIQRRFRESTVEMQRARDNGIYNAFVINDDLSAAIEEVSCLVAEKLKSRVAQRAG